MIDSTENCLVPKSNWAAVTVVSRRFLPLARVTASSFHEHNPDVPFFVVLVDCEQHQSEVLHDSFQVLRLEQLGIPELDRFCFQHRELELSYATTPFAINYLLGAGYERVLFLKQETLVLGRLEDLLEPLQRCSALLTPHFLEPLKRRDGIEWEINVLRAGVFNGGVVGFANCPEAKSFLVWWGERTASGCFIDIPRGLHYEQRWLDFATSLLPNCHICRDPGVNVGHWNLPERRISISEGKVLADGQPCKVFRFSGYEYERPDQITRYNQTMHVDGVGDAASVVQDYHARLCLAGYEEAQALSYDWDRFSNGEPVTPRNRRIYHALGDEVRQFGNPFEGTGANSFLSWLQHLPASWK